MDADESVSYLLMGFETSEAIFQAKMEDIGCWV